MSRHTTWSFYDPETGLFSGRAYLGTEEGLKLNTPRGMAVKAGRFHQLSQRVDLETGEVVEYRPPAPDDDHEWNADRRRWTLKPEALERRQQRRQSEARIKVLEQQQARPSRELALDSTNAEARRRLEAIEAEIAQLRKDV